MTETSPNGSELKFSWDTLDGESTPQMIDDGTNAYIYGDAGRYRPTALLEPQSVMSVCIVARMVIPWQRDTTLPTQPKTVRHPSSRVRNARWCCDRDYLAARVTGCIVKIPS